MPSKCTVIFPHQLYWPHPAIKANQEIYLMEHPLFFGTDTQYPIAMHQQKLLFHRVSMKQYEARLLDDGQTVHYIEFSDVAQVMQTLSEQSVHLVDPTDDVLMKRCKAAFETITWYESPNFINSTAENNEFFSHQKKMFMKNFYEWQRRRLRILIMDDGEPEGGSFSFDQDNRQKLPTDIIDALPDLPEVSQTGIVSQAKDYIQQHFADNPGRSHTLYYPTSHAEAEAWLKTFFEERFHSFGPYEDAIEPGQNWIYHSVLTPMLNVGLLTPGQIVDEALAYARKYSVPLQSVEGFIRQIIGWREFIRHAYISSGTAMRTANDWGHNRSLPAAFYTASTGLPPVDDCIQRITETGYCHHIERLMVLGGSLFLCEVKPDDIYTWFMEMFADSYDWVMVPNVYAMSQNSSSGLITTKPYFSGSSYIRKMSHYPKGDWCDIWDGLYWRFIDKHKQTLRTNPRWAMMCSLADKMDTETMKRHKQVAASFLDQLQ